MKCPYCNSEEGSSSTACSACGFPFQEDTEKRRRFLQLKIIAAETEQSDALELVGKSKYIFYFAAALTFIRAVSVFWKLGDTAWSISIGVVSILVSCGLIYLGMDVEKHPMRDSVIGLIATFLIMGGGIIGWIAMAVMAFCIYSAVVCERKRREVERLRTLLEQS